MLMHELLLSGAECRPDELAFRWVDRDRSLTYGEAAEQMETFAGAFAHLGVGPGDRVTVVAHNGLDYLMSMFGAWRIGAIAAMVSVKFVDDLAYYFGDHQPKVIVYTHDIHDAVVAAAAKTGSVEHLVCMDGAMGKSHSLPELVGAGFTAPPDPGDADAIAHLSYTSGTTGLPKGACLAHEPTVRATRCIAERLQITSDDVSFGPTALSSSYQLVGNLLPQLDRMASINVMGKWTRSTGYDALEAAGATMLIANPPILGEVLAESRIRGKIPGRLRMSLSGGGPVPPTLKESWRDELRVPLVESYGQSELGGFVALGFPRLGDDPPGETRIGPQLPDKEVRVVGADDRELPLGETGELVIRGGFMKGYWGKPDKTAEATRGGWLHTGDIGVIDRDRFITMRGRRPELIEVKGTRWYPRDVEEALCRQEGVALAALVGVPDPALGAQPVAFVTALDGAALDMERLRDAVRSETPYDPEPLVVRVIAEMPMTPTGKIAKAELAALAKGG
jgi:acyl-coenzyme A synthetase/AMP-(fatty) acid ligase